MNPELSVGVTKMNDSRQRVVAYRTRFRKKKVTIGCGEGVQADKQTVASVDVVRG